MRALSVQQPWAWAIFHGKDIENRKQRWKYRGPLAIHASMAWSEHGLADERVLRAYTAALGFEHWGGRWGGQSYGPIDPTYDTDIEMLARGAIIGVAEMVDCHHSNGCCQPWGEQQAVHLVLANPRELDEPIPCRGALGLWTPPPAILTKLDEVVK